MIKPASSGSQALRRGSPKFQRGGHFLLALLPSVALALCLFGDCPAVKSAAVLGSILDEIIAACRDPGTQWMVALCGLTYLGMFLLVEHRLNPVESPWRPDNANLWLVALVVVASLRYTFNYPTASRSTQWLILLAGLVLGKGAGVWCRWRRSPQLLLVPLVGLLLLGAVWHPTAMRAFEYRGQARWGGPWDNPNLFGLLMGVGVVLAVGLAGRKRGEQSTEDGSGMPNARCRTPEDGGPGRGGWRRGWMWGMAAAGWAAAAVAFGVGLIQSYSRGAWLGTVLGFMYLSWQVLKFSRFQENRETHEIRESRHEGAVARASYGSRGSRGSRFMSWIRSNQAPLAVAVLSLAVLGFWALRQSEGRVVRRAVSVGNAKDFSWRNRVAAWEGALQIIAEHPGFGVGWNQPEPLYNQFYKPPRLEEGMAIQLNDYLMLGMTLGLPALVCFGACVGLALGRGRQANGRFADAEPNLRPGTSNLKLTHAACRAAAIVLLTGFWFDGGLFKLPTATAFWVLLELGALNAQRGTQRTAVGAEIRLNRWHPFGVAVLGCLLLAGALLWASGRDPFKRVWFEVNSPPAGRVRCLAVLPKPVRPRPAVIYLHGAGGSLVNDGPDLRQMAESGLAVVSVEYDQRNAVAADAQVAAVLSHLGRQGWADTNAIVWAGFSLGANRALGFALRHPELQPRLLVNLAGGGGEELQAARAPALRCPVWLVHGKGDEVFPLAQVQGLAAWLRGNGVAAELRALADLPHNFGPERGVVFRLVGEHCLTQLRGAAAWQDFQSAAEWRATATPLWVWWLPAALCAGAAWWWRQPTRPTDGGRASCWVAAVFVAVALAIGAIQLVLPRLPVSDWALALARRWLVPTEAQADFAWLSVQPVWRGQSLGILLEHTELTHYTRGLVPWKPADQFYREWVLSPVMGTDRPVDLGWRRPLWESLYPRIRKESSPEAAAEIVVRHLRERVSVTGAAGQVARPSVAWQRQMTDGAGFERLCVAGLRAVGIPARRRADGRAELWNGATWQPAPWPLAL